ncbi:hypothetical protein [Methylopila sp. M107]|uniref:hypothetical protein n=1 Tax=Methylopila sp. M107 TaxID=1101190 RepID=UPI000379510F|nr:hypothetical protein [Methylopila sp. M107]
MKHAFAILAALAASVPSMAHAQDGDALEARLLGAMRYSVGAGERVKQPGAAIRAYIDAGYVDRKPTERMDYTDYRVLAKPARLLGQKLLVIEEEYMTTYSGCCVNAGVGAIVLVDGDDSALRSFARENRCSIDESDVRDTLKRLKITVDARAASISCRERDALKD